MTLQGSHSQGKAGITVTISLSEKGDLLRFQSSDLGKRIEHCCRLLGIAYAEINDVAIRRMVAQDRTAGKRSKKKGFLFVDQWNGDVCCRVPTFPLIART